MNKRFEMPENVVTAGTKKIMMTFFTNKLSLCDKCMTTINWRKNYTEYINNNNYM